MNDFLKNIISSLDTHSVGFSARKLSAIAVMVFGVIASHSAWLVYAIMNKDFALLPSILPIDYGFIAICLGLTTYEKVNKQNNDTTDKK